MPLAINRQAGKKKRKDRNKNIFNFDVFSTRYYLHYFISIKEPYYQILEKLKHQIIYYFEQMKNELKWT